jgi:hypothetical protein
MGGRKLKIQWLFLLNINRLQTFERKAKDAEKGLGTNGWGRKDQFELRNPLDLLFGLGAGCF